MRLTAAETELAVMWRLVEVIQELGQATGKFEQFDLLHWSIAQRLSD